jgi:hypothetical protein
MDLLQIPYGDEALQLQQMLGTPIEDQAAAYELGLLSQVLQNGMELLSNAESEQETGEILRQMIKGAFVIGRRHFNQLV